MNNIGRLVQNPPLHDRNHISLVDQLLVLHPAAIASCQALDVVENRLDALLASFFNTPDCKKTFNETIQGGGRRKLKGHTSQDVTCTGPEEHLGVSEPGQKDF